MSLSSALSIAQSALSHTSRQTTIVSRNVADANNPDYARRTAMVVTTDSGARVVQIQRATNEALFRQNIQSISSSSAQSTLLTGLDSLSLDLNGVEYASSPATAIGNFLQSLQTYSATPSNNATGQMVVESARQIVTTLNTGSQSITAFRTDIDKQIQKGVSDLNSLLQQFQEANDTVVSGTRTGRDVNDALDKRDSLLKKISEQLPVNAISRPDGDLMLVTSSGATLFEKTPRPVTFQASSLLGPGSTGNAVYVDGVALTAGIGGNTTAQGKLAAQLQLRDDVAVQAQSQLDEIARGLITTFRETDPNGVQPDAAGLFTWAGAPAVPAGGILITGLAAGISLNTAFDNTQGGNPALLRDGGANGAAYVVNATGGTSYTTQLLAYSDRMDTKIAFDPAAGIDGNFAITDYSTESISWYQAIRSDASSGNTTKSALLTRNSEALSNETGVNVDEEMSLLLDLEHTYEASARILQTIDNLLATLLEAMR